MKNDELLLIPTPDGVGAAVLLSDLSLAVQIADDEALVHVRSYGERLWNGDEVVIMVCGRAGLATMRLALATAFIPQREVVVLEYLPPPKLPSALELLCEDRVTITPTLRTETRKKKAQWREERKRYSRK